MDNINDSTTILLPNNKNCLRNSNAKYFKYSDQNGDKKYNLEIFINHLKTRESKGLVRDIAMLIGEERRDLIEKSFLVIGKDLFLSLFEKCLTIQNEGGIFKKIPNKNELLNDKKSTGGVLFELIKKDGGMSKQQFKDIFGINYKERNERKKLLKSITKLSI
jgi:hypothetical protein